MTLSELERDAVTELANIGVSRAAASLRTMVGHQVLLSVPSVDILSRKAAGALISERESDSLVAVQQAFSGPFAGRALLIFPQTNSLQLIRAVIGDDDMSAEEAAELEQEALAETGNVILNGCLATIANMLRQSITLSLPAVLRGSGTDLFQPNQETDDTSLVLFLYINFSVRDRDIRGYIAMLMDLPALEAMRVLIGEFIARYLPASETAEIDASASLDELRRLAGPLFSSIEHSGVPLAVTDPRLPGTPFVFVNAAFTRLTGHQLSEIAGRSWRILHGLESDRGAMAQIDEAMAAGQQLHLEVLCHRKDGTVFPNHMFISPVVDGAGRTAFFLSTHVNVSSGERPEILVERRKKEREEVADRLRATLSLSGGAAAWEWHINEGRIVGDTRFAALYGLNAEDVWEGISADKFYSIIHPDDQTRVRFAMDRMLQGAEVFSREYRIILPNGSMRWVHARGHCETAYDRPTRFTGVLLDTTDQKRVEEQLRIAQSAGGIGTFEHIDGFATAKVSPQFCRLLGLQQARDLPVRTINALVHAGDPLLIELNMKPGAVRMSQVEFRITRPDNGEVRWIRRRGEYLRDAETAGLRFSGVIYDITDMKRVEEELRVLNENLETTVEERTKKLARAEEQLRQSQKMDAIGQLTGGVAHDFNNLLTVIVGNLEILQRQLRSATADPRNLERPLDSAMRGAQRATALTQRLLAFSRQQPLDPKPVDLSRLVAGMSDLLRRTIGDEVAVETVLADGLWRAHIDANQLEMAILNLAVNARDAMPDGGKLTIETSNASLDEAYSSQQAEVVPGQYVMLAVSDTGSGMDRSTLLRAFEPFFTTKEIGQGTGLGLSQVYGFVKQSGGHVKLYSELGEGTTVKIYLPRWHSTEAASIAPPPEQPARGRPEETLLVVEDDADVRAYSCNIIRELGYSVLEASNGAEALSLLEKNPNIKMLFTDVGLPGGMNGRHLAEAARQRKRDLKVLFTTGYADNAIVHEGRLDPGVRLITKPFTYVALSGKLRDILDARPDVPRILVVEDEWLIRELAQTNLEELGFKVEVARSAADAKSKLRLLGGEVSAAIIDVGLPDAKGDVLVRELRAMYPSLPCVIATGYEEERILKDFSGEERIAFLAKPYTLAHLKTALETIGIASPY